MLLEINPSADLVGMCTLCWFGIIGGKKIILAAEEYLFDS